MKTPMLILAASLAAAFSGPAAAASIDPSPETIAKEKAIMASGDADARQTLDRANGEYWRNVQTILSGTSSDKVTPNQQAAIDKLGAAFSDSVSKISQTTKFTSNPTPGTAASISGTAAAPSVSSSSVAGTSTASVRTVNPNVQATREQIKTSGNPTAVSALIRADQAHEEAIAAAFYPNKPSSVPSPEQSARVAAADKAYSDQVVAIKNNVTTSPSSAVGTTSTATKPATTQASGTGSTSGVATASKATPSVGTGSRAQATPTQTMVNPAVKAASDQIRASGNGNAIAYLNRDSQQHSLAVAAITANGTPGAPLTTQQRADIEKADKIYASQVAELKKNFGISSSPVGGAASTPVKPVAATHGTTASGSTASKVPYGATSPAFTPRSSATGAAFTPRDQIKLSGDAKAVAALNNVDEIHSREVAAISANTTQGKIGPEQTAALARENERYARSVAAISANLSGAKSQPVAKVAPASLPKPAVTVTSGAKTLPATMAKPALLPKPVLVPRPAPMPVVRPAPVVHTVPTAPAPHMAPTPHTTAPVPHLAPTPHTTAPAPVQQPAHTTPNGTLRIAVPSPHVAPVR